MRVLGLSAADLSGWRDEGSPSKWAPMFRGLAVHADVLDVVTARTPRAGDLADAVLRRAGRGRRRDAADLRAFAQRTADAERRLRPWDGRCDVVLQLQTLCAPGTRPRRYAICTDGTRALFEREGGAGSRAAGPSRAQRLEAGVARDACVVMTFSAWVGRSFVEDYGVPPDRVVATGAGANLLLRDVPDRRDRPPVALFAGYDFERKGGRVLLEAWREVAAALPGARLVVAGPRRPVDRTAPGVRWAGRVGWAELARLYREATVFVLPSLFEPFGFVVLEAMGHGLPVIASRACALPELVDDGVDGLLAP
ncbi:MAG TPA: glycosyltransferase family 4 protein, partial [Capillimicrobium sp.]|nr:glycosyltransferase family 4 protein [Capillimicrobium sp.]